MKNIYTSVDIGSDSIKVVVCELYKNRLSLLAASSVKADGIKRGVITDVIGARNSFDKALAEVEVMLGVKIKKVIASVPSYSAEYTYAESTIKLNASDDEINVVTGNDVIKVMQNAVKSKLKPGKELVTVIPIDFTLDEQVSIKDPKGLTGSNLSVRTIMVTTPKKNIYSVVSLIENSGIEVVDISLNNIGDIYAFKTPDIDKKVGAIINVGSDATSVSLYNKGVVVKSSIFGLGGGHVDNDISYIYNITREQSLKIKEKFALAHKMHASVNDLYEIKTRSNEVININQFEVSEIAMSRLEEILNVAKNEMQVLTNQKIEYIIITGGTSNMAHFNHIAEEVFGKDVVIGDVKLVGVRNNKYSSSIGNIVYFVNKLKLRGRNYSMFSTDDMEEISSTKRSLLNISNESMLGKVFGYFWSE